MSCAFIDTPKICNLLFLSESLQVIQQINAQQYSISMDFESPVRKYKIKVIDTNR